MKGSDFPPAAWRFPNCDTWTPQGENQKRHAMLCQQSPQKQGISPSPRRWRHYSRWCGSRGGCTRPWRPPPSRSWTWRPAPASPAYGWWCPTLCQNCPSTWAGRGGAGGRRGRPARPPPPPGSKNASRLLRNLERRCVFPLAFYIRRRKFAFAALLFGRQSSLSRGCDRYWRAHPPPAPSTIS